MQKTINGYIVTCKGRDFIIQAGFNGISNFGYSVNKGMPIVSENDMGLNVKEIRDYIIACCK